jgi:parallel beta-helix repeat protein
MRRFLTLVKNVATRAIDEFAILILLLLPTSAAAQVHVHCDEGQSLQRAINVSRDRETILVSGTCDENVTIPAGKDRMTLDGGGTATIRGGLDPTSAAVSISGRDITIRAFTITARQDEIEVARGGSATIDGNTIRNAGRFGISLVQGSSATIVNNTIHDNGNAGIGELEFVGVDWIRVF